MHQGFAAHAIIRVMKRIIFALLAGVLLTYLTSILTPEYEIDKKYHTNDGYTPVRAVLHEVMSEWPNVVVSDKSVRERAPSYDPISQRYADALCKNRSGRHLTDSVSGYPAPVTIRHEASIRGCPDHTDITRLSVIGTATNVALYGAVIYLLIVAVRWLRRRLRPKQSKASQPTPLDKKRIVIATAFGLGTTLLSASLISVSATDYLSELPEFRRILYVATARMPQKVLVNNYTDYEGEGPRMGETCLTVMVDTDITIRGYLAPVFVHQERHGGSACDGGGSVDKTSLFIGGAITNTLLYGSVAYAASPLLKKLKSRRESRNSR